jgi:hypothetical protein
MIRRYFGAVRLFLGIVWREHENGWRVDIRTAWEVARIMWL